MKRSHSFLRFCLVFAFLTVFFLSRAAVGQGSRQDSFPKAEPRFAFDMRDKTWGEVINWICEKTGLPLISNIQPPPGKFKFMPPKDRQDYTIREIIDLVNEGLAEHRYFLLRRDVCFTLIPTDESPEFPPPHVLISELPDWRQSEIVMLTFKLNMLKADDFAYEVKKLMTPVGGVIPLTSANSLVLIDTAGSLRKVVAFI